MEELNEFIITLRLGWRGEFAMSITEKEVRKFIRKALALPRLQESKLRKFDDGGIISIGRLEGDVRESPDNELRA